MSSKPISYRYARTLYKLAESKEEMRNTLHDILEIMKKTKFYDWLLSPQISKETKEEVVKKVFKDRNPGFYRFFSLLIRKNRIKNFPEIVKMYAELTRENPESVEIKAVSSAPIPNDEKEKLIKKLEKDFGKKVILREKIQLDLIGGVVLFIGDKMIDGSLKNRLLNLKEKLLETSVK